MRAPGHKCTSLLQLPLATMCHFIMLLHLLGNRFDKKLRLRSFHSSRVDGHFVD